MFYGSFRHSVDSKGRVAVPAQFRRDLGGAIIAPGSEGRLVIRPAQEWQEYVLGLRLSEDTTPDERLFMRHMYADAHEVDVDAQGRMLLSPEHRAFAQISDRAVFVGLSNVIEIVGEAVWDAESAGLTAQAFSELGDRIRRSAAVATGERP